VTTMLKSYAGYIRYAVSTLAAVGFAVHVGS
jgi:hypothetical protein